MPCTKTLPFKYCHLHLTRCSGVVFSGIVMKNSFVVVMSSILNSLQRAKDLILHTFLGILFIYQAFENIK